MSEQVTPEQVVLVSDVYLGDWSHSVQSAKRATDAKATFYFPGDEDMRPLTTHQTRAGQGKKQPGKLFRMYLIEVDDPAPAAVEATPSEWGMYARDLKLSGFLRTPEVWAVLGTDADFREWVSYQPSVLSGEYNEWDDAGYARNVACHVLRAHLPPARQGAHPNKPAYACVPMTDAEHRSQHNYGERVAYCTYRTARGATPDCDSSAEGAVESWFDQQRIKTVERWAWAALKQHLGVESMADADPDSVYEWALGEGIERHLPASYRQRSEA